MATYKDENERINATKIPLNQGTIAGGFGKNQLSNGLKQLGGLRVKPDSIAGAFAKGIPAGAGIVAGGLKSAGNRLISGSPEYQSLRKEGYGVIPATLKTGANQFEQAVTPALNTVGAGISSAYNTLFSTPEQQVNQPASPPNLKQAAGAVQNRTTPEQPAGRTLSGPGYSVSAQPGQFQGLKPITADSQNQLNNTIALNADPAFQQRLAEENALVEARTGYGQQQTEQAQPQLQTAQPTADYSNEIDQLYSIINSRPPSGSFEGKLRHKKQVESALASLNQIVGLQNAAGQQALLGARDANQAQLGAAELGLRQDENELSRENAKLGALSDYAKLAQQAQFEQAKLNQNRYNTRINPETGEAITYAESGPAADESYKQQQQLTQAQQLHDYYQQNPKADIPDEHYQLIKQWLPRLNRNVQQGT